MLALFGLTASSCEERADPDNPESVMKAKERSEYVLVCAPEKKDETWVYTLLEVVYNKPGVKVPWSVGELVSAPMLDATGSTNTPDRAVIFYESWGGEVRPIQLLLFYPSSSPEDASKLEKILRTLKQ